MPWMLQLKLTEIAESPQQAYKTVSTTISAIGTCEAAFTGPVCRGQLCLCRPAAADTASAKRRRMLVVELGQQNELPPERFCCVSWAVAMSEGEQSHQQRYGR